MIRAARHIESALLLALCVPALPWPLVGQAAQTPAQARLAAAQRAFELGDYPTALKELLPLAKLGNADAQYSLGVMYGNGQGVPRNEKEAARWYRLAAEQGDADAQFNLGYMYF